MFRWRAIPCGTMPEKQLALIIARLRELRCKKGLSHEMLAKKAGVSRPAISHIENGRRKPSLMICLKIAKALEVDFAELVKETEKDEKPK